MSLHAFDSSGAPSTPPTILADITFLTPEQGGRQTPPRPPWTGVSYMPHAVVEGSEQYLGIQFLDGPAITPGVPGRFVLALFYPEVDYSALQPGVAFTLREGPRIVARGLVIERRDP